ncbi:THUMP domain-containing class I SAM-dependent RNA methyltransferase [Anaeromyxobacter terrae]|uniref:THUMP domain-containing class I SAM-dependent RNA methyltransferase n=1 Tax=Anaeromyxobacter terrae TaxID=2925406 RepID=UPI001F59F22F|nr:RNA methyltransferase [Anaeromyxobacter sp. SG22]
MSRSERIFCACAPGLEPVLAAELASLGLAARAVPGGAEAEGEDAAALACLASRTADAVLLRLWEGDPAELPAAKRTSARRAGGAGLEIRTGRGRATISVDAAGAPLFRRGWRARVGAAPLRESLAAGILLACGWEGDRPFLDPMCGSGTIAIEAALVAGRRAPGLGRSFAFETLPGHDPARTGRLRARLASLARPITVPIHASDRNAGALRLAQKNAAAAGIADAIRFERADAARVEPPPGPGLCAVNPPYGVRLDEDTALAWRALGALVARLHGWEVAILGPDRGYERLLPLAPASALPVRNGGIACRLLRLFP